MMRQIYNVESPPSSMLYDTSALTDGSSIQNSACTPNNNTDINVPHPSESLSSSSSTPSSSMLSEATTECCNRLQEFALNGYLGNVVKQHQLQRQQQSNFHLQKHQQQQPSPSKSNQLKSNSNSPSRLSLANLMPSRLALIFSRFLLFSTLHLYYSKLICVFVFQVQFSIIIFF